MSSTADPRGANLEAARQAGRAFAVDLDLPARTQPYDHVAWRRGDSAHPTLQLDDVSGIPFLIDIAGVEEYQHRGRLRAGDHDVYVTVTPEMAGYEKYCREILGLGAPEHLVATPVGPPIAVAKACSTGKTRARLIEATKEARGLTIHPYMGIEDVWELAAMLAADSREEVRVLGPPPPVTWVANDKSLFDELVARVLGRGALVETRISRDVENIRTDLHSMTTRHERVGLKRTRCASAMGNAVFSSANLRTRESVANAVDEFLKRTEWPKGEDVLTVAWLDTDISPSTQLWIPPLGLGQPRVDGIYEQILTGEERVFVGSRPSSLPDAVNQALAHDALQVAAALQELGYVGRCSFDHLVTGDPEDECEVLFTECNGRWGGTSTPMSLLDRLLPKARPPYRAQDVVFPELIGARLSDLFELIGDELFETEAGRGRFIFYNLGPLDAHGKFDVISIGNDPEDAERGITEILPKLLRLA